MAADPDDDADTLTYTWSGSGVTFSANGTNDARSTRATFSASGVYVVTLVVSDPLGATARGTVSVTVQQTLSLIDVTAPSYALYPGEQQQFTATQFDQFGHPMATPFALTWQTPSPNTVDQNGLFTAGPTLGSTSVQAIATLIPFDTSVIGGHAITILATTPPTIAWIAPSNNATFASGDTISLEVSARAAVGTSVTRVEFFADSQSLGTVTPAPYIFAWNGASVGSHVLTARATDSNGLTATTLPVTVIVTAPQGILQSLSLTAVSQGDPAPTLTLFGLGFTNETQVTWDGQVRPTTLVDATRRTLSLTAEDVSSAQVHTLSILGGSGSATFEVVALVDQLHFEDLSSLVSRDATIRASGHNAASYVFEFFPENGSGSTNAGIGRAGGFTAASVNGVLSLPSVSQLIAGQRYHVQVTAANRLGKLSSPAEADIEIVGDDYNALRVYPNPYRTDKDTGGKITFDRMTPNSTVKLFSVSGQFVKRLDGTSGLATWDLTTDGGDNAASGIYLYVITNPQGQKAKGKLALIR